MGLIMATTIRIENIGCEERLVTVFPYNGGIYKYGWVPGGSLRKYGESMPFASSVDEKSMIRYFRGLYGRHPLIVKN